LEVDLRSRSSSRFLSRDDTHGNDYDLLENLSRRQRWRCECLGLSLSCRVGCGGARTLTFRPNTDVKSSVSITSLSHSLLEARFRPVKRKVSEAGNEPFKLSWDTSTRNGIYDSGGFRVTQVVCCRQVTRKHSLHGSRVST
jgi:hypothetical protein